MTKKTINKQDRKTINITTKQKKVGKIVGFSLSVILLVLVLLGILAIKANVKSESEKIMEEFYQEYEANDSRIIFYYNSTTTEDKENEFENTYMTRISKEFSIDYLTIDISKLNSKDRNEIEEKIGVSKTPSVAVVKNKNIVAVQQGYIESNRLVDFLINAKILKEGSKYKEVSDLKFIKYKEYTEILNSKKRNVIVIGQSGCEYCIAVKPTLNNIARAYDINIYYLDVMEFNKSEYDEFFDTLPKIGYDNEEFVESDVFDMPTVFIVKDGKIINYLSGANSLEEYKTFFKDNEVIE